jgi:CheY-like chemotaxis protein
MSIKILLADDSVTIQKVIGIIFGGEDYSLTVVDNGKAALDKALEIVPDILLIDALMPGMSGYEVCERIRATPSLAAKPILFLTGSFEPFDETKAKNCGADDFIAKPFESQQIIAKVAELCERAALRSSDIAEAKAVEPELPSAAPVIPPVETTLESVTPSTNIIWDAFTPSEPPTEATIQSLTGLETDSFSSQSPEPVESPWIPIDEQSFQFEEESAAAMPTAAIYEQPQADDIAFGDSPFTEPPINSVEPIELLETPAAPPVVPPEKTDGMTAPQATSLTEEQLKEAIATASKDVIERIVWEVVPDLAEAMIKEAIRRITENQQ